MLLVAGSVVEEEEALRISVCEPFKDVDRLFYLGKQVFGCEPAIPVLASLEYYSGFTVWG